MQGRRGSLESSPESIDLNQGTVSNNTAADQSAGWDHLINPVESRLSNYMLSSGVGNIGCTTAGTHSPWTFGGWDPGESSSRASLQDPIHGDGLKIGYGVSSSSNASAVTDVRSEFQRFEPSNVLSHEIGSSSSVGNHSTNRLTTRLNYGSAHSLNANLNDNQGISPDSYKSSRAENGHLSTFGSAFNNIENSSGSGYLVETDDGSSGPLGSWGLSCKRKALESGSGQSYPGGSSSSNPQAEGSLQHNVPSNYTSPTSLSMSLPSVNMHTDSHSEQPNPRIGVYTRGEASDTGLPLNATGIAESSRSFGFRTNLAHQESLSFDFPSMGTATRHSSVSSAPQPSRTISVRDSSDLRLPVTLPSGSSDILNQSRRMQGPGLATNTMPLAWNGSLNARGGSSSSSLMLSRERDTALCDESIIRSSLRNIPECPFFASTPDWSFTPGNTSSSRNLASGSRTGSSSASRTFPTVWIPHQNTMTTNQQRSPEIAPWALFPHVEPDASGQRANFSPLSSASSSSREAAVSSATSSRGNHHSHPRSTLLLEVPGDDINGWHALAADIEGRQRLVSEIRQVLTAMRRGDSWRAEDAMLFDPFINGAAEFHDRHRDMRLDVDNMSYEELLALEERIGNVSTGLTEEVILRSMKHRKHQSTMVRSSSSLEEPCCICQEGYLSGDDIGTLDCGHEFHSNCIKQWLTLKNLCPICKMTGLET